MPGTIFSGDVKRFSMGRGGGQEVIVLAFYSDDPSSNPADANIFYVKCVFEKKENKQKEAIFLKNWFIIGGVNCRPGIMIAH